MAQKELSIAIIGGGIGGLSAALSLLDAGLDVHVYERARTISEIGAGIAVSPNATRILYRLGLARALETSGVKTLAWHYRRWDDGRTLLRYTARRGHGGRVWIPALPHASRRPDRCARAGVAPGACAHRAHVQDASSITGDQVEAEFENGAHIRADALVGADGIHSTVRQTALWAREAALHGLRRLPWPGAGRSARPSRSRTNRADLDGAGQAFRACVHPRSDLVNFVAVIEQDAWTKESWSERGEVADVLAAFEGWHPQVRAILRAVDETFLWALFDRKPMARWSVGRVTLLGDACHPMLPFKAQGAAQAIEDGATLAACLSQIGARGHP